MHEIDKAISELDIAGLSAALPLVGSAGGVIVPRDYQWLAYVKAAEAIRKYKGAFIVNASVGAGKTIMMAMLAKRFRELQARKGSDEKMMGLILARQAELIRQNSDALFDCGVKNSTFSAGLKSKSIAYGLVAGTEKSIFNGLYKQLGDFAPSFIFVDEAHMVDWEDLISDNPTTVYAQIILEMQRRCRSVNRRELIIIGFTGSPFRHIKPIIGKFWIKQVCEISSDYLVKRGFLVPTIFGDVSREDMYDLSEFSSTGDDGMAEFSDGQLKEMESAVLKQGSKTQRIMQDVVRRTANRNGVLITCSGKKHCEEAAKYLPPGSYVIVTESMGMKARTKALEDAKYGKVKYVFQIGCLTTGVDCSYWDTSVLLRKIGSLTLLIQLLGRGMRLPKDYLIAMGIIKEDHLVLDYTDTMAELGGLYNDPILEAAELAKAKKDESTIQCPVCSSENSPRARRCIGEDASTEDGRCEYFFSFKTCDDRVIDGVGEIKGCGAKNDPCARQCRKCGQQIYDPNAKLNERFYTDDDYVDVTKFEVEMTKDARSILYKYEYERDGEIIHAKEYFLVEDKEQYKRNIWITKGALPHVRDPKMASKLSNSKSAKNIMGYSSLIEAPVKITHRVNDRKVDIISRKVFSWDLESQQ